MTITWNDQAHTKLLFAILTTSNVKLNHDAVAKIMGNGCTTIAIRRRIQKIVAEGKDANADADSSSSTESAQPSQKPAKVSKKSSKKRKSSTASPGASDVPESEEEVIPKKKTRRAPVRNGSKN